MTMGKNDFSSLLNAQLKKATETAAPKPEDKPAKAAATAPVVKAPVEQVEEPAPAPAKAAEKEKPAALTRPKAGKPVTGKGTQGRNTNRVTVNLFEADSRALAVIRELLGSVGHDFTSRSDSMKIGLRLAAKAKPEELAKLFEQVKAEDRRYSGQK